MEFFKKIQELPEDFLKKRQKIKFWALVAEPHFWRFLGSRGGRHLFGQNVTLMTGDDAYFSKASPFKITILTEHLEKIGQKVTLLTNLDPPWSTYESINFLVLSHFWTFFFAKTGKCRFYTSISDFIEFSQNINFTL